MYNNSFWELKKKLIEAARKSSLDNIPPEGWTNRDGDTRRKDYVSAREAERRDALRAAHAALKTATQTPDHGIDHETISGLLSNPHGKGNVRRLFRAADRLSNNKNMLKLRMALQDVGELHGRNPPHPKVPEPDYGEEDLRDRRRSRRDPGDPGSHFPFYPGQ